MRNQRFIAEHRGGLLKKEEHLQLMEWACKCVIHVLPLSEAQSDKRITKALNIAEKWLVNQANVGETRAAALGAIEIANTSTEPITIALARATGHTVATAHMADHALVAALYALKTVKSAEKSVLDEKLWQEKQLPATIKKWMIPALIDKARGFKL